MEIMHKMYVIIRRQKHDNRFKISDASLGTNSSVQTVWWSWSISIMLSSHKPCRRPGFVTRFVL